MSCLILFVKLLYKFANIIKTIKSYEHFDDLVKVSVRLHAKLPRNVLFAFAVPLPPAVHPIFCLCPPAVSADSVCPSPAQSAGYVAVLQF